jgi:hypothetical protein
MKEIISGCKIILSRKRTTVVSMENMLIQYGPRGDKPKRVRPKENVTENIEKVEKAIEKKCFTAPEEGSAGESKYSRGNYWRRRKLRKKTLSAICYNTFEAGMSIMLSLTFDTKKYPYNDLTDLKQANEMFKGFIRRIENEFDGFVYVAVYSRQGNETWHYHVICNLPNDVQNEEIAALWKHGGTYTQRLTTDYEFRGGIQYMNKNMDECAEDKKGFHGYFASKNVQKDKVIRSWDDDPEFDRLVQSAIYEQDGHIEKLYETKSLVVKKYIVNEVTGEVVEEKSMYAPSDTDISGLGDNVEVLQTVNTHYSTGYRDEQYFQKPQVAVRKKKS